MAAVEEYDYIVVGGGSAGCPLAARLSERNSIRVLLIEAGTDYPPGQEPPEILDIFAATAYADPRFVWSGVKAAYGPKPGNAPDQRRRVRYPAGRVIGGGSSINGMAANRGLPSDYDAWATAGATGWNWDGVLPFFKKLETDSDFDGPLHGKDGPIRLQRYAPERWPGFTRGVMKAIEDEGWSNIADQNARFDDGFFPVAYSHTDTMRMGAAWRYLTAEVRRRPNLTVLGGTQADRLLFDGARCTGVRVRGPDGNRDITAREAHRLKRRDPFACAADAQRYRSGTRASCARHQACGGPSRRRQTPNGAPGRQFRLLPETSRPPAHRPAATNVRGAAMVVRPRRLPARRHVRNPDQQGTVACDRPSPRHHHDVGQPLVFDRRDQAVVGRRRRAAGHRFQHVLGRARHGPHRQGREAAGEAQGASGRAESVEEVFPISFSDYAQKLAMYSRWNVVQTWVGAQAMDASAAVRRAVRIRAVIADAPSIDDLVNDEDTCRTSIRSAALGHWHASCTCRMGRTDDPLAVTDASGRVIGVQGLRVADASIMPSVPCANTNLPTIMIGEKIAATILDKE